METLPFYFFITPLFEGEGPDRATTPTPTYLLLLLLYPFFCATIVVVVVVVVTTIYLVGIYLEEVILEAGMICFCFLVIHLLS